MIKQRNDSEVEIWGMKYINSPEIRFEKDKDVNIYQIEPGNTPGDYMVEFVRKKSK